MLRLGNSWEETPEEWKRFQRQFYKDLECNNVTERRDIAMENVLRDYNGAALKKIQTGNDVPGWWLEFDSEESYLYWVLAYS